MCLNGAVDLNNAAGELKGRKLESGWNVIKKLDKNPDSSGGFFSECYIVEKDGQEAFLKAFSFESYFRLCSSTDIIDGTGLMLDAFRYERDLSELCQNRHVTKVVFVKSHGVERIEGNSIPVPYLIFDLADGDVRRMLAKSSKLDSVWRLKSLHELSVGLMQLHKIEVAHQDLKPSNIMLFDEESRIGDLGSSVCKQLRSPFNDWQYTGDKTYAPPEVLYEMHETDWQKRVYAADCYLLGSMIVFYFVKINMTALIWDMLPEQFNWRNWNGSYSEVLPYVIDAYSMAVDEFKEALPSDNIRDDLTSVVEWLCHPDPSRRGHPRDIEGSGNSFNLERFVTILSRLHKRLKYDLRTNNG